MEELQLKKIIPQVVQLFTPENKSLGNVNEYELLDFMVQIKKAKAEGYYCVYDGQKLVITVTGRIKKRPAGFFELYDQLMSELL